MTGVREQAEALVGDVGGGAVLVDAGHARTASRRGSRSRDTWRPPIIALFVPDGVALEATATSRTALR